MIVLLLTEFRVNLAINRRQKIIFNMAAVRHMWICCNVIILHPGTLYYVPNIALNVHLDWFSTF